MMRNNIQQIKYFSFFLLVLFVFIFGLPQKSLADRQDIVETCKDQNTCPGFCTCDLRFLREKKDPNGRTIFNSGTRQKFYLYNEGEQVISTNVDAGITWELYIGFNSKNCGISVSSSTSQIPNFQKVLEQTVQASKQCDFQPAFCCCKVDENKKRTGCRRYVDRDINNNFARTCAPLGLDYEAVSDPQVGAGCAALNTSDAARAADDTTSNINLRDEVRGLNQLSSYSSVNQIIAQLIKILLAFIGSIALFLYVWAGLLWMTAAGSSEKITKSKSIMVWTTLGVAVMLGSYVIVTNLFDLLSKSPVS
jgi:hypothetical protein